MCESIVSVRHGVKVIRRLFGVLQLLVCSSHATSFIRPFFLRISSFIITLPYKPGHAPFAFVLILKYSLVLGSTYTYQQTFILVFCGLTLSAKVDMCSWAGVKANRGNWSVDYHGVQLQVDEFERLNEILETRKPVVTGIRIRRGYGQLIAIVGQSHLIFFIRSAHIDCRPQS